MARITTSKGEATLRPMLAKDEIILGDLAEAEDDGQPSAYWKLKARMVRALDDALIDAEWEGGFGEVTADEVLRLYVLWNVATDEQALPEGNAPDSETPQEPGR